MMLSGLRNRSPHLRYVKYLLTRFWREDDVVLLPFIRAVLLNYWSIDKYLDARATDAECDELTPCFVLIFYLILLLIH